MKVEISCNPTIMRGYGLCARLGGAFHFLCFRHIPISDIKEIRIIISLDFYHMQTKNWIKLPAIKLYFCRHSHGVSFRIYWKRKSSELALWWTRRELIFADKKRKRMRFTCNSMQFTCIVFYWPGESWLLQIIKKKECDLLVIPCSSHALYSIAVGAMQIVALFPFDMAASEFLPRIKK